MECPAGFLHCDTAERESMWWPLMNFFGGAYKDVKNWDVIQTIRHTQYPSEKGEHYLFRGLSFTTANELERFIDSVTDGITHESHCTHWTSDESMAQTFATDRPFGVVLSAVIKEEHVVFTFQNFHHTWDKGLARQARQQQEYVIQPHAIPCHIHWLNRDASAWAWVANT